MIFGLHSELHLANHALLHHARGCVDGVPEESVPWQLLPDHSCNNGATVNAHFEFHVVCLLLQHIACGLKQISQNLLMSSTRLAFIDMFGCHSNTANKLLADCLNFCNTAVFADPVKLAEDAVEEIEKITSFHPAHKLLIEIVNQDKHNGYKLVGVRTAPSVVNSWDHVWRQHLDKNPHQSPLCRQLHLVADPLVHLVLLNLFFLEIG
mmetsp:Transcript_15232/g.27102  ORF Transcript_15232/g.27102 Transcript_15232/m.27102 type:complete len:208 (+) Transcript_15232:2025-2648(+)